MCARCGKRPRLGRMRRMRPTLFVASPQNLSASTSIDHLWIRLSFLTCLFSRTPFTLSLYKRRSFGTTAIFQMHIAFLTIANLASASDSPRKVTLLSLPPELIGLICSISLPISAGQDSSANGVAKTPWPFATFADAYTNQLWLRSSNISYSLGIGDLPLRISSSLNYFHPNLPSCYDSLSSP